MLVLRLTVGVLLVLSCSAPAFADVAKQRAYGQHLGRECVGCHRIDGVDNGIPGIVGWPAADFVVTMGYYKGGQRPNAAMASVAQSLDDDQIAALAAYFASVPVALKK
jgi:cytochrome c